MSVINQMLRDLQFEQQADVASHHRPFKSASTQSVRGLVGLLVLTIAFAALIGFWPEAEMTVAKQTVTPHTPFPIMTDENKASAIVVVTDATQNPTIHSRPTPEKSVAPTRPKARRTPEKKVATEEVATSTTNTIEKSVRAFQPAQEKLALFNHEESAIARWQQYITQTPDDYGAQLIWLSYWMQRDRLQAEQWAERALQHNPDRIEVRQMLAQLHVQNQQSEQAIAVLRAQQPAFADAPDYYALLAQAHLQLQQFAAAATLYQLLTTRFPQHGRYWAGMASSLQGLRRTREEQAAWQQALNDPQLNDTVRQYALQRLQSTHAPADETQ